MENNTGYVFDIQRYSVHDGPGIRTTVFLKGCPLTCPWCSNPESQKLYPELAYFETCCHRCGECTNACPESALSISRHGPEGGKDGAHLNIDRNRCNVCGLCVQACRNSALRMSGLPVSVEEVLTEVAKDQPFYRRSGGGVTLSGGEPVFQADFAKTILAAARGMGIHTAIETSGMQKPDVFSDICDLADTILYDIKIMNADQHQVILGVSNDRILCNLINLIDRRRNVIVRIPIIPGYTDSEENVREIARFLSTLSVQKQAGTHRSEGTGIRKVDLIPYHRLGEFKYGSLGRTYTLSGSMPPGKDKMERLVNIISEFGFSVQVGG